MNFLTRNGSFLHDGNQVFRFISYNTPNLHFNQDGSLPIPYEQDDTLLSIQQINGKVARTYVLSVQSATNADYPYQRHIIVNGSNPTTNLPNLVFNEPALVALDSALAIARNRNVRLILPIIDNWEYWGGVASFSALFNQPRDSFYTNSTIISAFTGLIGTLANRTNTLNGLKYSADPSLIWETGNELQTANNGQIPSSWTLTVARYIKSVAPRSIVIDGSYGINGWPNEVLADSSVDVLSNHYYATAPTTSEIAILAILLLVILITAIWVSYLSYLKWGCCLCLRRKGRRRNSSQLSFNTRSNDNSQTILNHNQGGNDTPGTTVTRKGPSRIYFGILSVCLLGATIGFIVLGYQVLNNHLLNPTYSSRFQSDVSNVVSNNNKPLIVGEFGLAPIATYTQLLDAVVNSQATGALIWSLRSHHKDGGFYTHSETNGYAAYHHPGLPADPSNGFPADDPTVPPLIRSYAAKISGISLQPIVPPPANLLSTANGSLMWRGSAGASSYEIQASDNGGTTFTLLATSVTDNKPGGSVLYTDKNYTSSRKYRIYAFGDGGTSNVSNVFTADVSKVSATKRKRVKKVKSDATDVTIPSKTSTSKPSSPNLDPLQATREKLLKEPAADLRARLGSVGLATQGSKSSMIDAFLSHVLEQSNKSFPATVIAIDLGYLNVGIAHISIGRRVKGKPTVLDLKHWNLVKPDLPPAYDTFKYALGAIDIVQRHLLEADRPTSYVIERQQWRPGTAMAHTLQRVRAMEAMIFAILVDRASVNDITVDGIHARSMTGHFELQAEKSERKKTQAVSLVRSWMSEGINRETVTMKFRDEHIQTWESNAKKDDLADALLMGIAYIERLLLVEKYRSEL
ncbi:hypothetical protein SmJEL517_g02042 [Synchytrium microbalum]|uniref:mannan endo-1,4-beta-mannosidase n=1 Tax=Synchytrium microbalum TaxID=1806994 RepID=A0A507C7T3_9FUNG|nr:uncharacterized protein SmJEL517_g02042 [Synchytrium microbalum]TPX35561.1 hypothetical protein SmJEL517_g02042 [Synchytrium microbalum]